MDQTRVLDADEIKLAIEIFNEINNHRWNSPIPDFLVTGKVCGYSATQAKLIVKSLINMGILQRAAQRSVKFTRIGYDMIEKHCSRK